MRITVTDRRFFPTLSRWVEAGETVDTTNPKKPVKMLDSVPVKSAKQETVVNDGNSEE